ncbi:MAG: hypothetical protein P0Y56_16965 [Candidatus Andeanibacterium colombiense]|uniref:Cell envelope biogenesis protein TolA n=1 Tax=Candidatus Andeanibacterium colombiense TaxID=3121345 RepID=A0AAJ6BPH6_9SPHN|nr:MAG: hypothetical protein P0Y56_16965 [Sphingomonadaceae bacterium]
MAKLKVFRTPIGFHDAYVAAPSRKAALSAWGSDADLFARGVAEEVIEPELTAEPLADPGKVIRRSRGTAAEQIAALPKAKPRRAAKLVPSEPKAPRRRPVPKPDRGALDQAEAALRRAEAQHAAELRKLADELAALQRRRREIEAGHIRETERLKRELDGARGAYERALRGWNG